MGDGDPVPRTHLQRILACTGAKAHSRLLSIPDHFTHPCMDFRTEVCQYRDRQYRRIDPVMWLLFRLLQLTIAVYNQSHMSTQPGHPSIVWAQWLLAMATATVGRVLRKWPCDQDCWRDDL